MKTQAECYQALLNGKILHCTPIGYYKLLNGELVYSKDLRAWERKNAYFSPFYVWSIHEEKPKPKYEVLYECLGMYGHVVYCFESGKLFNFSSKKTEDPLEIITEIKNGRKLLLNMGTWEVCEYDKGLL